MAAISELIRTEGNGTLSFGDYTLGAKAKLDNYEFHGDKYKVKTFKEITKLERNGLFVYESVPGTAVTNFTEDENTVSFTVEGPEDAQITLELAEETEVREHQFHMLWFIWIYYSKSNFILYFVSFFHLVKYRLKAIFHC